ncbi:MAG: MFS transporter [Deltaproteobacteria bacterium]|nr:MFS transporter [Deltaproteobacteria bacterium]
MNPDKKAIWGWVMYDWANSAFATTVMAGFFPIFFKKYWSFGTDINTSTAQLGFGNALGGLIVALMAPVLGAIADSGSAKKKFLIFFAYMGAIMTACLYLVEKGAWPWAILFYVMGVVGFSGSLTFYDGLLPHVAGEKKIDYVSGLGFSMGYLGGGLLFLINVLMTLMPHRFGLSDATQAVKCSFVSVAVWWGLFTVFTILWVPEVKVLPSPGDRGSTILRGFRQFAGTFRKVSHLRTVFLFLLAYWFYIDGVDTIIRMAVDYGMSLGFDSNDLIVALLIVQFVGFPAALGFARLGERWGARKAIFLAIGVYVFITMWGVFMKTRQEFYALAVVIGLVQGGIQALSRSYYARLIPGDQSAEYFGFYNMLGKFAAIVGPALMGSVGLLTRRLLMPPNATPAEIEAVGHAASRWGLASVLVLFVVGAVLFYFVDEEKGRAEVRYLGRIKGNPET